MSEGNKLVPKLRFPEFRSAPGWQEYAGSDLFNQINNRNASADLPVLAITQEYGAIPRELIDYHVSVTEQSLGSYKVVNEGDFIISLRSFQGGIEYSRYHGICSPAYVILRLREKGSESYFRHYLKTEGFIRLLTRNLEGLRDGKMISYKQFSELRLPVPSETEQERIAECLSLLDELIAAQARKVKALGIHKNGLIQQLFPNEGETYPSLRHPEFVDHEEWTGFSIQSLIDKNFIVGHLDGNHGSLYPRAEEFSDSGIPYISAANFNNGRVDFAKCRFLPADRAKKFNKGVARDGDVLFAHNATVGPVAKLVTRCEFVILGTSLTSFRCNEELLSSDFLRCALISPWFVEQCDRVMSQSTRNQVPITTQRTFNLQIPTMPEQRRIADCLSALDEDISAAAQVLDNLMTHKKGLMQQLFPSTEALEA